MITLRSNEAVRVNLQVDAGVIAERNAKQYSKDAESWATGKRDGVNVPSTDPAYENNAKYYAEQTEAAKTTAVQAIQTKGEQVLQSIPSEYTELSGDVEDLKSAISLIVTEDDNGLILTKTEQ